MLNRHSSPGRTPSTAGRQRSRFTKLRLARIAAVVAALVALPAAGAATTGATSTTNLVANPSFESSLTGWTGYYASLSRVSGGAEGSYSARVTATQSVSWSISPAARQVASAVAGTTYTAKGWARTRYSSRSVCIRLREWSGSTVVAYAEQCVTTSSSWKAFPTLSYTALRSGSSLDLYAFSRNGRRGDSFDVDGLSLTSGSTTAPAPVPAPAPAPPPLAVSLTPPPAAAAGSVNLAASVTSGTASRVEFLADGTVVGSDTTSPYSVSWDTKTRADGNVSVTARAVGSPANATSNAHSLRIDNTAPESAFVSAPTGTVTVTTADVAFTATETSSFQCQLNAGAWASCGSPETLTNLGEGTQTYRVRATDSLGNVEPTPAVTSWTVSIPQVAPSQPTPSVTCDRVAAPGGSDANDGTLSSPFATPQKLADTLTSGQTGCLRAGSYTTSMLRVTRSGFRLRSYPGERARLVGIVYLTSTSSNVTLSHLDIEGTGTQNTIQVHGTDMVIEDNTITNKGRGLSCMILGDNAGWGAAHRSIVRRNTFHDCGATANGNKDHGIYAANIADGQILNNVFWNTASYAIHVYPNSQRMRVAYNVIDGAGPSVRGGIIVAGDARYASNNTTVEYNVVAYAASYNIETYWEASVGSGNIARKNCVWAGRNGNIAGSGLSAVDNLTADPLFVNRSAHDYRLSTGSPCRGLIGTDPASNL